MGHDPRLEEMLAGHHHGALVTLKRDGRPQVSNVLHHYDPETRTIRISVTDDRAKTRNARRDPRVSYYVTSQDRWSYAVAEGTARMTPVAAAPDDETVEQLVELYRALSGEHPDWAEYRAAMVDQRRLVLTVDVERVYGLARG